jgi:hypothetical protein
LSSQRPVRRGVPPTAPDYPRLLRLNGLVIAIGVVGYPVVAAIIELGGPGWLAKGLLVAVTVGWVVGMLYVNKKFWREERERSHPELAEVQTEPLVARVARVRKSLIEGGPAVRARRMPGLILSLLAGLAVPLVVVGAVAHVQWVLVSGLVLLGIELMDVSIRWPIRRAREARSEANRSREDRVS